MTEKKVLICSVGCVTLAVIIQGIDLTVRKRYAANTITVAVITIFVLVKVVSEVQNVIDRVLPHGVAVGIEKSEREVTARIHSKTDFGY